MSALRDEIRAILREEIAVLRGELSAPQVERVKIRNDFDLNRFAADIAVRAADPEFLAALTRGAIRYELAVRPAAPVRPAPAYTPSPMAATPAQSMGLTKLLITEKDIAAMDGGQKLLRIGKNSRLTPLARDEARRKGIKVERGAA